MGWSQLLNDEILKIPRIGTIGSHPTELPKFRGRAPIPWTILKDLKYSAESFFWIDAGTDTGEIVDQRKFPIKSQDDASTLYEKITKLAQQMAIDCLNNLEKGNIPKIKQDPSKFIENWPKRTAKDGKIDWSKSAEFR